MSSDYPAFPPQVTMINDSNFKPGSTMHTCISFVEKHQKVLRLYAFKSIVMLFLTGVIFISAKLFSETYMEQVYVDKKEAPSLIWMIGIIALMMGGVLLFLCITFYMLHLMFIDNSMFDVANMKEPLIDIACFLALLFVFASLIASIIQCKRYFKYKVEGLRAIRAFGEILVYVSLVLIMIPYICIFTNMVAQ